MKGGNITMDKKEFKKLKNDNEKIRDKITLIFDDLGLIDYRGKLWKLINDLIENEIAQEKMCGE